MKVVEVVEVKYLLLCSQPVEVVEVVGLVEVRYLSLQKTPCGNSGSIESGGSSGN